MNSINRYTPVSVPTSVNIHGVRMQSCDDGAWVSYAMHKKEIESLQARLKALESKQKDSINTIISGYVDDAIRKSLGEVIHNAIDGMMDSKPKYNGDPCHGTVDAFVNELAAGPGKTVKADTYGVADELKNGGTFTFGSNFGEGKALTMSVGGRESEHDRNVAVCLYGDGHCFITGDEYFYEIDSREAGNELEVIYICSDVFASDLKGLHRWTAHKSSPFIATYEARDLSGETCGIFYIK